jgi:hypothetical protein
MHARLSKSWNQAVFNLIVTVAGLSANVQIDDSWSLPSDIAIHLGKRRSEIVGHTPMIVSEVKLELKSVGDFRRLLARRLAGISCHLQPSGSRATGFFFRPSHSSRKKRRTRSDKSPPSLVQVLRRP